MHSRLDGTSSGRADGQVDGADAPPLNLPRSHQARRLTASHQHLHAAAGPPDDSAESSAWVQKVPSTPLTRRATPPYSFSIPPPISWLKSSSRTLGAVPDMRILQDIWTGYPVKSLLGIVEGKAEGML